MSTDDKAEQGNREDIDPCILLSMGDSAEIEYQGGNDHHYLDLLGAGESEHIKYRFNTDRLFRR